MNTRLLQFKGRSAVALALLLMLAGSTAFAQTPVAKPSASSVTSVTAPVEDIHDIRGPKPITSVWLIPLIATTVLLAAGGTYAAWTWNWRRLHESRKQHSEIAMDRLDAARALMLPEHGREFSIEVSSIVREYIESRFRVMAAHLTTHEFLHDRLKSGDSLLATHRALLGEFLESCDLAKFGGWNLSLENMETLLQSARRFIVESREPAAAQATPTDPQSIAPRERYDSVPST